MSTAKREIENQICDIQIVLTADERELIIKALEAVYVPGEIPMPNDLIDKIRRPQ